MTPEQQAERSSNLLGQFDGLPTGDVITILAIALQMAICYGAQSKTDAMDIVRSIMRDAERDLPHQYDIVRGMAEMLKGNKPWQTKPH